jgi:hypothetical protein
MIGLSCLVNVCWDLLLLKKCLMEDSTGEVLLVSLVRLYFENVFVEREDL